MLAIRVGTFTVNAHVIKFHVARRHVVSEHHWTRPRIPGVKVAVVEPIPSILADGRHRETVVLENNSLVRLQYGIVHNTILDLASPMRFAIDSIVVLDKLCLRILEQNNDEWPHGHVARTKGNTKEAVVPP